MAKIRLGMAFVYLLASMAASVIGLIGILYYAWNEQWLPAIFVLLARKEMVRWTDSEWKRLSEPEGVK